jgi:aspartate racemase
MKIIGLIGGMSWNSSLEYYCLINELVSRKLGGLHSARVVLYNIHKSALWKRMYEPKY